MSVARGGGDLSKNGRDPLNGMRACLICTWKFPAAPVLHKSAVQMLMKIKFGHVGTPELNAGCQPSWRTRLYEAEMLASKLFPQSGFFGDWQRIFLIGWSRGTPQAGAGDR
jgi:hypothetical protein